MSNPQKVCIFTFSAQEDYLEQIWWQVANHHRKRHGGILRLDHYKRLYYLANLNKDDDHLSKEVI